MMPVFVLCKLYNNGSWLLTRTFQFPQPVTPVNTYLTHFYDVFKMFLVVNWQYVYIIEGRETLVPNALLEDKDTND